MRRWLLPLWQNQIHKWQTNGWCVRGSRRLRLRSIRLLVCMFIFVMMMMIFLFFLLNENKCIQFYMLSLSHYYLAEKKRKQIQDALWQIYTEIYKQAHILQGTAVAPVRGAQAHFYWAEEQNYIYPRLCGLNRIEFEGFRFWWFCTKFQKMDRFNRMRRVVPHKNWYKLFFEAIIYTRCATLF